MPRRVPVLKQLWPRLLITDTCWLWQGAKSGGYGAIGLGGKFGARVNTHVVVYEALRGPVPDGLELDHLCRNRACANPKHLEPVTHQVNILRGYAHKELTAHCKRGHPRTPENTYTKQRGLGVSRECRECALLRSRVQYLREEVLSA